jgi:CRISPR-associated protein Cas2
MGMSNENPLFDEPRRWIISYDIRCQRRLSRLGRFMRKKALRLQYSVYLAQGDKTAIACLMAEIRSIIDPSCDDVRAYPLGKNTRMWGLGTQFLDGGNPLVDEQLVKALVEAPNAGREASSGVFFVYD